MADIRTLGGAEESLADTEYSVLVKNLGKERADALMGGEEEELDDELKELLEDVEPLDEM